MKRIHTTAATVSQRVKLQYSFKVDIGFLLVPVLKEKLPSHEIEVWIVIGHLDSYVIVFHRLLLLPFHLIAPAASIVCIADLRRVLDGCR